MHKSTLAVKKGMLHCKRIWGEYYIIKMDVKKYFQSINREILENILKRKIKKLKQNIKNGTMKSKEARKYLCGHIGYIKYADIYKLRKTLFYD